MTRQIHLNELTPDPLNARRHTARNIAIIEEALQEVGAARSIVIDENGVILAGNGTVEAAGSVGITQVRVVEASGNEIIAVRRTGLTQEQKRRLSLFDNRAAELAGWDPAAICALTAQGVRADDLWHEDELERLISYENARQSRLDAEAAEEGLRPVELTEAERETKAAALIDRASECQQRWKVERGQVFTIDSPTTGLRHRVCCGDSENAEDRARLLDGMQPGLLHGDPPYGIPLIRGGKQWTNSRTKYRPVTGDDELFDPRPFLDLAPVTILWGANHYASRLPDSPFWIVWNKQGSAKHRNHADAELAWCNAQGNVRCLTYIRDGFRRDSEKGQKRFHQTQKPVAVIRWALQWVDCNSVLEPWLGSGSTLFACDQLNRQCFGLEIDPVYIAVTLERAKLEGMLISSAE
ncbi:MAG: DNA methyltransferase [Blastocatellia bacterium]